MSAILGDISEYLNVQANLRQLNQQIITLEDLIRSDADVAREIARDVLDLRTNYEAAAMRYIDLYRAVTGSVPEGLTGLGILPALPVWAVVTIAVLAAGVLSMISYAAVLYTRAQNIQAQKQQAIAQTQASLIAQAADLDTQAGAADQRGDSTTAAQLRDQADQLRVQAVGLNTALTDTGITSFMSDNWPWLLLAGGAAVYALKA